MMADGTAETLKGHTMMRGGRGLQIQRKQETRRPKHKSKTRQESTLEGKRGPIKLYTVAEVAALNAERLKR
jgi:hypothetical protein